MRVLLEEVKSVLIDKCGYDEVTLKDDDCVIRAYRLLTEKRKMFVMSHIETKKYPHG